MGALIIPDEQFVLSDQDIIPMTFYEMKKSALYLLEKHAFVLTRWNSSQQVGKQISTTGIHLPSFGTTRLAIIHMCFAENEQVSIL